MPIIKSAKKALRQTKKRTIANKEKKATLKKALQGFDKKKEAQGLASLYRLLDKMVRKGIIHQNKASRIKSRAAKSLPAVKPVKKLTPKKITS